MAAPAGSGRPTRRGPGSPPGRPPPLRSSPGLVPPASGVRGRTCFLQFKSACEPSSSITSMLAETHISRVLLQYSTSSPTAQKRSSTKAMLPKAPRRRGGCLAQSSPRRPRVRLQSSARRVAAAGLRRGSAWLRRCDELVATSDFAQLGYASSQTDDRIVIRCCCCANSRSIGASRRWLLLFKSEL